MSVQGLRSQESLYLHLPLHDKVRKINTEKRANDRQ